MFNGTFEKPDLGANPPSLPPSPWEVGNYVDIEGLLSFASEIMRFIYKFYSSQLQMTEYNWIQGSLAEKEHHIHMQSEMVELEFIISDLKWKCWRQNVRYSLSWGRLKKGFRMVWRSSNTNCQEKFTFWALPIVFSFIPKCDILESCISALQCTEFWIWLQVTHLYFFLENHY